MKLLISKNKWKRYYQKVYCYFLRRLESDYQVEEATYKTLRQALADCKDIQNLEKQIWTIARKNLFSEYIQVGKSKTLAENSYSQNYFQKVQSWVQALSSKQDKQFLLQLVESDFSQIKATQTKANPTNLKSGLKTNLKTNLKKLSRKICKLKTM